MRRYENQESKDSPGHTTPFLKINKEIKNTYNGRESHFAFLVLELGLCLEISISITVYLMCFSLLLEMTTIWKQIPETPSRRHCWLQSKLYKA